MTFYGQTLGLDFLFETNGMAFFQAGSVRLMVGTNFEDHADPAHGVTLYFDAPDLPNTADELEERGVVFLGPAEVVQRTPDGSLQLRFFRDPDGNLLALMGLVRS